MTESQTRLSAFEQYLYREERARATVEKYLRDATSFELFAAEKEWTKDLTLSWKQSLIENGFAVRSINSMLASLNAYLRFLGREDCRVKYLRVQREVYRSAEEELTKEEYQRLLNAAESKPRLHLLLQTVCATGIRVSELRYFTVEAVRHGEVTVRCKSKTRTILLPGKLRKKLLSWAKKQEIRDGVIFRTREGNPLDRSNIWSEMKGLCAAAGVAKQKVFPHNLRKLFARMFYAVEKDIAKLADLLGHSSVNTTRVYIISTGTEHRRITNQVPQVGGHKPLSNLG